MSGHSKWSKVKHQKATTDVAKSAAFTKASRAIVSAVIEGGGVTDPENNFRLRLAVEKARAVNMPKENIERIIQKAKGEGGSAITSITYDGYGPYGVALIIEAVTDNPNRSASFIKQILEYAGGSMASPGATSYLFSRQGLLLVAKENMSYDQLFTHACEAGAQDVIEKDDVFEIYTNPQDLSRVKKYFEEHAIPLTTAELVYNPTTTIPLDDKKQQTIEALIERLEEVDDVQNVYSNVE